MLINYTVYDEHSDKDWIVLLHGIGGSSTIWYRQIPLLRNRFKVLLIDLPSHGISKDIEGNEWNLEMCINEIKKVLLFLRIEKYHILGVSLGTILIHELLKTESENIKTAVMAGGVIKFNKRAKFLLKLTDLVKNLIPLKFLYFVFAYILMPRNNHKESRIAFIKEAKKVEERGFMKWYSIINEVESVYDVYCRAAYVDKLYISGEQDYMFLNSLKKTVSEDPNADIIVIKDAGHVCNIDKSKRFNFHLNNFYDFYYS